jgi:hypothetical protein
MKRSVKVDLSWRAWSLIVGFFILLSFIGLSFAYNSGASPSVMGHSASEIEGGTGGTTIVSSCMPDYFNGISKNNDVSYQAATDGWVKYSTTIQYGTSTFSVSSNNISWVDLMSITAGDWPQRDLGSISLVKAGTYYKGAALTQFVFYPCLNSGTSFSGSGFSDSLLSTNGYQKLPSGLIMQWGKVKLADGSALVTFPIAFPNALLNVNAMYTRPIGGEENMGYYPYHVNTTTPKTTFKIATLPSASYNNVEVYWQAIGY